jgi:hypothetical protein
MPHVISSYEIRQMDLARGLHVIRHDHPQPWGIVTAIGETPERDAMTAGPLVTVRWWLGPEVPPVISEHRAGDLRRVHRRLHEDGHPEYCAADCEGAHYGDHIAWGECCERCGGNKRSCVLISGHDDGCGEGWGPEV